MNKFNITPKDIVKAGTCITVGAGTRTLVRTIATSMIPPELSMTTNLLCRIGVKGVSNLAGGAAVKATRETWDSVELLVDISKRMIHDAQMED